MQGWCCWRPTSCKKSLSGKLTPFCTVHCSTGHWEKFNRSCESNKCEEQTNTFSRTFLLDVSVPQTSCTPKSLILISHLKSQMLRKCRRKMSNMKGRQGWCWREQLIWPDTYFNDPAQPRSKTQFESTSKPSFNTTPQLLDTLICQVWIFIFESNSTLTGQQAKQDKMFTAQCHFLQLTTRNQFFGDKKCRVLTFRDKMA